MSSKINWHVTDKDTNAAVTATKAAKAGHAHVITAIFASLAATAEATLTVTLASGVTFEVEVYDNASLYFEGGLRGGMNEAVSASLAAGGADIVGNVTLIGYTV